MYSSTLSEIFLFHFYYQLSDSFCSPQVLELGLELEERNGGIFVKDVLEYGSVAAHGETKA